MLVLAIDGHGAAGKSTIAGAVARATGAALVHTDDFFRTPTVRPHPAAAGARAMACYYDWRRLRAPAAAGYGRTVGVRKKSSVWTSAAPVARATAPAIVDLPAPP